MARYSAALLLIVGPALSGQTPVLRLRGPVTSLSRFWRVGGANGALGLAYARDTIWVFGSSPRGPFAFRGDLSTMAMWADSARAARFPDASTARFAYYNAVVRDTVVVELTRLSADATASYQCSAAVGAWHGALLLSGDSAQRLFALLHAQPPSTPKPPPDGGVTFFDFQVEKQAGPAPGSAQPAYPEPLRVARVAGEVLAQFVVDTMGVVDLETFKVLASTDPWFISSVYDAMPRMRFKPAEKGGQKVRELVQEPFVFNLR